MDMLHSVRCRLWLIRSLHGVRDAFRTDFSDADANGFAQLGP